MSATVFVPGNISCLFTICPDPDPAVSGSLGVGFTVNKGVTVTVSSSEKTEVFFNNRPIAFPTVMSVVHRLSYAPVHIAIESELPLGAGFGLSGASALATAYAINELFNLQKQKLDLAKIAHIADVENGTGLGDVVNEYYGGFFMKTVPSSQFIVGRLPIHNTSVFCKSFSKLPTKEILSDKKRWQVIDEAGKDALEKIKAMHTESLVTFQKIISLSKEFALRSGLLTNKDVLDTIADVESCGGHASMIMLGNGVFSDIPFPGAIELLIQ